jgi:hypothetical protein
MPSRKQRRRRQKERRHEYEYVYVDDAGQEVEPLPREERPERRAARNGKSGRDERRGRSAPQSKRSLRAQQPPSWTRSGKRALLFFPLFFIVFTLVNKDAAISSRLVASLGYSVLFIPLTYMMDRTAHRAFLRRSGAGPDPKRR